MTTDLKSGTRSANFCLSVHTKHTSVLVMKGHMHFMDFYWHTDYIRLCLRARIYSPCW